MNKNHYMINLKLIGIIPYTRSISILGNKFIPYNNDIKKPIYVKIRKSKFYSQWVQIELLKDKETDEYMIGTLIQVFGPTNSIDSERIAIGHSCGVFPRKQIINKKLIDSIHLNNDYKDIVYPCITIDNESTQDMDDGIWLTYDGKTEQITVNIYITDVASIILNNPSMIRLLENAYTLNSTIYTPEKEYPMFPKHFAHDIMSLKEGCVRKAINVEFVYDKNNCIVSNSINHRYVVNKHKYSYSEFENSNDKLTKEQRKLLSKVTQTSDSHKQIEYMMILYNQFIGNLNLPNLVYRFQNVNERAQYTLEKSKEHISLECKNYVHSTSPIRRFTDIIVQYAIHRKDIPIYFCINDINFKSDLIKRFHYKSNLLDLIYRLKDTPQYLTLTVIERHTTDSHILVEIEELVPKVRYWFQDEMIPELKEINTKIYKIWGCQINGISKLIVE